MRDYVVRDGCPGCGHPRVVVFSAVDKPLCYKCAFEQELEAGDRVRAKLKESLDMLEEVLSSDPDMPTHDDTMRRAEELLKREGRE